MSQRKQSNKMRLDRASIRQMIKSSIISRAEHKYYTFTPVSAVVSSNAGVVYNLTRDLIEGDNVEQRSGRKVQAVDAHLRISALLPVAGLAGVSRFIWVIDNLNTGTLPTVGEIIDSTAVTAPYSLSNVSNKRFTVLADRVISMVVGGSNQHVTPVLKSKKKSVILYNGGTCVNTANGRGSQFLLIITDLAANGPVVTADYDLSFLDI